MRKKLFISVLMVIIFLMMADAWAGEIHPALEKKLQKLSPGEKIAVIIELKEQARFSSVLSRLPGRTRSQRVQAIVHALREVADRRQGPLREYLNSQKAKGAVKRVIPFWVFNGMAVTATEPLIRQLAARPEVWEIRLDSIIPLPSPFPAGPNEPSLDYEWNIERIRAPEVWALDPDYNGAGSVVGIFDTGVDVTHPDLFSRYRGDHQISWYDPYDEHLVPYDPHGHGTHTAGTAVGGDAGGSSIGVAPGATWIAAKAWNNDGIATASAIHQIFEWFLAPGGNPDNAPDVVNNSWSFTESGCNSEFLADIQAWRAAGIFPAFAAGNFGPYPGSVRSPGAYAVTFAVGASDLYEDIALFSGRGVSPCDGSIKPDVSAPGVGILSAYPSGYATMSGTSMATPHIAGAVAVLRSINPALTVDQLETALTSGAVDLAEPGLDNDSGAGRLDLFVSAQIALLGPDFPVLKILATDAVATEAGPTSGAITISRTGNTDEELEVKFSVSGTATPVSDYDPVGESIIIQSGSDDATVFITPVDDALIELDETVSLTILSDPAYFVPGSATATVSIESDELLPDLDITSMSSPTTGGPGSSITITDTTKNIGGGVADESVIQFYLSADNTIDTSDTVLGSRIIPALATGVSSTGSITVTIPESTLGGTWYIIGEADSEEVVLEDSEINNSYMRTIGIGPDLDITSFSVPATASPGESIVLTDTTKNKGTGVAGLSVTHFYLSTNSTIDAPDTLLGSRSVPSLEAGQSSTGSTTVTIPESTTTGKWYIIAKADGEEVILETVETNNTYVRSTNIGSNMDLNIPSMSAPMAAGAGQSLVITDTTKNIGTGAVDPSVTQFYLSADNTIDASDIMLGSRSVPSLAGGASSTESTTVTIPESTAVGSWWIIAKADGEETVTETSETNNTYIRTIGIGPDLDITSLSAPATAGAGESIVVTDTVQNIGGDIDPTVTQFYLSANNTIDVSDTLLGSRIVPSLAGGASSAGSTTVTIPENATAGTWYIIGKADGEDVVLEISETNNSNARTIGIGPDLDITSMSAPTTASPGQSIAITDTTMNKGAGVVVPSVTQFYLSADNTIDASDTMLGSRSVPSLAGGASSEDSTSVLIPGSTAVGDWWIVAKADGEETVSETSETNNTYVRSITIGSDVDLSIAGLSAPTTASPGNNIVITDTTRNIGAGIAGSSVTHFYLSANSTVEPSDVLLGSRSVPELGAGASSVGSTTVTIPADTSPGNWWIIAKADGEEAVSEASEANNAYARSISIGSSDADLDITYMSAPTTAGAGQDIFLTDTTKNRGDGAVGPTMTQFYLSVNPSIDASDFLLGGRSIPSLESGASSTGTITVTIPENTATASWYIIGKADGEEIVSETSETNNTYTRSIGIGSDLDVTSFRVPSSANPGQNITLTDTTMNRGAGVADPSLTHFYLSLNSRIDASDTLLGSRSVSALEGGMSSAGSTTVMIPGGTAIRKWYIIAKADGEEVVSETSETNNNYVRSIRIK